MICMGAKTRAMGGLGMWGTGGLGVDYREEPATLSGGTHMKMVTALQLMQFGTPVAYTKNGLSIGITPIVQYASLDINYEHVDNTFTPFSAGSGVSDDISFGLNVGLAYEVSNFTIGAVYKSEIEMEFEDVLNNAIGPMTGGTYDNDKLSSPEEYGVGISYTTSGHTLAVDWKHINWEDAETYKDFGWEDQDVIAIGYEYAADTWSVRCGYQYAESAVQDNTGKGLAVDTMYAPGGVSLSNTFNLLGFPGTQEEHVTVGASYTLNEMYSIDFAAVFGLENTETMQNFAAPGAEISTEHSENSYSVQINYSF